MAGDAQMDPHYLPDAARPDLRARVRVHQGEPVLLAHRLRDGMPFMRAARQHRAVVRHQGGQRLLEPVRPAERLHRDQAVGAAAARRSTGSRCGYEFENDLLIWLNIVNARAKDVPVPALYGEEVSTMKLHKVTCDDRQPAGPRASGGGCCASTCCSRSRRRAAVLHRPGAGDVRCAGRRAGWSYETLGPPVATTGSVLLCRRSAAHRHPHARQRADARHPVDAGLGRVS